MQVVLIRCGCEVELLEVSVGIGKRKLMTTNFKHTYAEQNALLRDLRKILAHGDER